MKTKLNTAAEKSQDATKEEVQITIIGSLLVGKRRADVEPRCVGEPLAQPRAIGHPMNVLIRAETPITS